MKIFKFGGASINSIERVQNIPNILQQYSGEQLMLIISAMGKTTNALEKVAESFYEGKNEEALQLFDAIKMQHITLAKYLLVTHFNDCLARLNNFFTEVEWLLHDKPVREFDYYYDQIVCAGEMLSTAIVSSYLNEKEFANTWLDVRDIIKTDNNFRDASIDFEETVTRTKNTIQPGTTYITQGFIGCTDENESTTLGREGSDYTAAVFANILSAESVTIWKDVEGVMSADPKEFPDATHISELSYTEVIEMAFYGAQVIHPKTIKPLQNKNIPLLVKSFINPLSDGTIIHHHFDKNLPPIIVNKQKQVLVNLSSLDFSFVGEKHTSELYQLFSRFKIKPNLIQTGAINISVCLDDRTEKIEQFALAASSIFNVQLEKELSLFTIRHYNEKIIQQLLAGKEILLEQKTKTTLQAVYKVSGV